MKRFFSLMLFFSISVCLYAQTLVFDNATRAVYILDIAKYVKWNDQTTLYKSFNIGVLSKDTKFYWELVNVAKSRVTIQAKPIHVVNFRTLSEVDSVQVLFVANKSDYSINEINNRLKGKHVLLITENFDFNKSMINFIAIENKPKFEANEAAMNKEGMTVSQLFLSHAVKTREEWESLFKKTEAELDVEKQVVKQQSVEIENQAKQISFQSVEIEKQKQLLTTLNSEISTKQQELKQKSVLLEQQLLRIKQQTDLINNQKNEADIQKNVLTSQLSKISAQNSLINEHEELIDQQRSVLGEQLKQIEKQRIVLFFVFLVLVMVMGLGYFIYRNYKIKKEANILLEAKNKLISEQKNEIENQRDIANMQRDQIAYQKQHITDSIEYAKRIQTAVLPDLEFFTDEIEHFVLFRPKDIVSGDFYWHHSIGKEHIIVVADCTGHGVPGAFMSMLGISLLNEIVKNKGVTRPDLILNELRFRVINSLIQNSAIDVKDGMDITVCNINTQTSTLLWSGANNPIYLYSKDCVDCIEIKGDKMPVAAYSVMDPFTLQKIELNLGDTFYMLSDGYADQFGGDENKKFLSKNLRNTIMAVQNLSMIEQGKHLSTIFDDWKGTSDQVDDVTVMGIRYSCYSHE